MRTTIIAAAVAVLVTIPTTALATHLFTDVPHSNPHAAGIAYAVDTGLTSGCDDDRYCPNDPVTRAQMATFLHRQSGNGPVEPSVNADTLRGLTPDQLGVNVEQIVVTQSGSGVVHCPEGSFVTGGGFLHSGMESHEVYGSHPVARAGGFGVEGWYVGVNQNGSQGQPIAWAVCLKIE